MSEQKTIDKGLQSPKVSDKIKQPSPLTFFLKNHCENCEDLGDKCNTTTTSGREYRTMCLWTLAIQSLQWITYYLEKLCQKIPEKASSGPVSSPQIEKVQRSTRPTECFEEDGLVWVKVFESGTSNIKFLKAYAKDNQDRQRFKALSRWITSKGDKPFAKHPFLGVECEVFLWNFNQGPKAIGKSKCKSGDRR